MEVFEDLKKSSLRGRVADSLIGVGPIKKKRKGKKEPTRLLCPWDLQARILEWGAISFSRGSSQSRDQTRVSSAPVLQGGFFTTESPRKSLYIDEISVYFSSLLLNSLNSMKN